MSLLAQQLELLAPARTAEIGQQAILHGADAVYIGGPAFGARSSAANSVVDIANLVNFAHKYRAKIFVTFNTILHDAELEPARKLIYQLYDAGVDALIIQDMGLLEIDLPPIELHASTQCDIRSVEKAIFLANSGFSQLVLARELTLQQIQAIHAAVQTPLEFFIHGALCVAYSGQCFISHAHTGRSANRGDCSQACRLPYNLLDSTGAVVAYDKHLLSMKDNDQSNNLLALVNAGVRSFKIEGRYKDMTYVKNITGHYRRLLDELMDNEPSFNPASDGKTVLFFQPNVEKNFHRGQTDYFLNGRTEEIAAFDSPKFIGESIGTVSHLSDSFFDIETETPETVLSNGDGLNFMRKREVIGMQANVVEQLQNRRWRIFPNETIKALNGLKKGITIHRNRDHAWELQLNKTSAQRRIAVSAKLWNDQTHIHFSLTDTIGCIGSAQTPIPATLAKQTEQQWAQMQDNLMRLGNTEFLSATLNIELQQPWFLAASQLNALRREAVNSLQAQRLEQTPRPCRKPETQPAVQYPETHLSYLANVYNQKARQFYHRHGVSLIDAAYEAHEESGEVPLMITKHCLRFSFNLCPKQAKGVTGVQGQVRAEPMVLQNGTEKLTLKFDCKPCEMLVIGKMKKNIFKSPPPGSNRPPAEAVMQFMPRQPL